jgi:hypothetical protein
MTDVDPQVAARAERYSRLVEAELSDLPPEERSRLTRGLAAHLAEAGETGIPLVDEQGTPRHYAAELRATVPTAPPARTSASSRRWIMATGAVAVGLLIAAALLLPSLIGGSPSSPPTQTPTSATPSPAVPVPNLIGLRQTQAVHSIDNAGLRLGKVVKVHSSTVPKGVVAEMSPSAGSMVPSGTAVDLIVSG